MKNDIYEKLDRLIKELQISGKTELANILNHRIKKVAWTTSSELFDEIRSILSKELKTNERELSATEKDMISSLLKDIQS